MRKLILTILLASSVALPAMAQDRDGRNRDRGARQVSSDERQQARQERRAQRVERQAERRPEAQQQAVQPRQAELQRVERATREQRRTDNGRGDRTARRQSNAAPYAENGQLLSQRRDISRDRNRSLLGQAIERSRARQGQVVVQRDRDDRSLSRYSDHRRQWNNHWRGDRNYDWRSHRNRHRSIFRLGNYYDPYGSRYRRFSIGFSLFPSYYSSNNWLNDPWQYRLPPAYGPYRWVRYYDDALLVNVYTGQVVDVVHSFFW